MRAWAMSDVVWVKTVSDVSECLQVIVTRVGDLVDMFVESEKLVKSDGKESDNINICYRFLDSVIAFRFSIENIDRIANTVSDDVCNRLTMLKELLPCKDGMLCLSDESFSSNDVEQLISFLCTS